MRYMGKSASPETSITNPSFHSALENNTSSMWDSNPEPERNFWRNFQSLMKKPRTMHSPMRPLDTPCTSMTGACSNNRPSAPKDPNAMDMDTIVIMKLTVEEQKHCQDN